VGVSIMNDFDFKIPLQMVLIILIRSNSAFSEKAKDDFGKNEDFQIKNENCG
jgi:hypothetical protein